MKSAPSSAWKASAGAGAASNQLSLGATKNAAVSVAAA